MRGCYGLRHGREYSSDEDGDGPHNTADDHPPARDLVRELQLISSGITEAGAGVPSTARVQMAKPKPKGKARTVLKAVKAMQLMYADEEGLALSLLDGIGCCALGRAVRIADVQ